MPLINNVYNLFIIKMHKNSLSVSNRFSDSKSKEVVYYIDADKPLTYNFTDVTTLDQLRDKEPTSGKRKEPSKGDSNDDRNDLKNENKNYVEAFEDENEKATKKTKNEPNEICEGSFRAEKFGDTKGKIPIENKIEVKKEESKIKIQYKKYINSFNVSNNKITSLQNIQSVLLDLLPELTFQSKLSKVELLQWIDISRNKLTDIHPDITTLPYLKILYVHGNNIQEIERVVHLSRCKSLTNLTLYGNPIDHIRGYRHFIIEMCPLLEKLDSALVSEKELDVIKFGGSRYGEIRRKGVVVQYPKLPDEIIKTIQLAEQNSNEKKDDN